MLCSAQEEEDKENDEEKEEEEEPLKEMTLDEWKALQDKEKHRASFELRKPGEGEKKGMWKNTKVYKRSDAGESEFASKRVSGDFKRKFVFIYGVDRAVFN